MEYDDFLYNNKDEVSKLLRSESNEVLISTIIGAINGIDDWEWLQNKILVLVDHNDFWVAKTAINGIGDIARIHKKLDSKLVFDKLKAIKREDLSGVIDECIKDINIFLD